MRRRQFIQTSLGVTALGTAPNFSKAEVKGDGRITVINAGVGGNNTADVLARLAKDCLSHKPGLTVLMLGTNDMNSRKFIPQDVFVQNLTQIVQSIVATGSKIVLMNLLPVYEPYLLSRHDPDFYKPEGHRSRLISMNAAIHHVAREHDLSFLDLYSVFEKAGNIGLDKTSLIKNEANSNSTDGLHPTAEGYRMIGVLVYQHIVQSKLVADKIVCLGDSITRGDGSVDKDSYPAWLKKLLA